MEANSLSLSLKRNKIKFDDPNSKCVEMNL